MNDILYISPVTPRRDGMGIEKRAWAHLTALRALGPVYLLVFTPGRALPDEGERVQLDSMCRTVFTCEATDEAPRIENAWGPGRNVLREFFSPEHTAAAVSEDIGKEISALLAGVSLAAVLCFRIRTFPIWETLKRRFGFTANRVLVDFDDIESAAMARRLPLEGKLLGKETSLIWRLKIARVRRLESRILNAADHVLACSTLDRDTLRDKKPRAMVHVLPNIAPDVPSLPIHDKTGGANILYVGAMGYPPNANGAIFFSQEVWPLIQQNYRQVLRLWIVGFRPPETVLRLADDPNIEVTGGVDSVIPYYRDADMVIVPLHFGGGTRIKILEAMAIGRPVVSTTLGAEGIDYTHGENILIADTPDAFADACVALLDDPDMAAGLVAGGRKLVSEKYSQETVEAKFSEFISS